MVATSTITVNSTDEVPELIDITDFVIEKVTSTGVNSGQVLVFSQHTTAAVLIQEPETGIHKDIKHILKKMVPKDGEYHHTFAPDHIEDKMPNGHSHLQHFILGGASQLIPLYEGKLLLGTYQRIFLVELDRARTRNVVVQVVGE